MANVTRVIINIFLSRKPEEYEEKSDSIKPAENNREKKTMTRSPKKRKDICVGRTKGSLERKDRKDKAFCPN